MRDSRMISFVKAFSWRIWGTLISYAVAFWVTGDIKISMSVGSLEALFKIFIFYFHERIWQLSFMTHFAKKIDKILKRRKDA